MVAAGRGRGDGAGLVAVEAPSGERVCGTLGDADPGNLSVSVDGREVVVQQPGTTAADE